MLQNNLHLFCSLQVHTAKIILKHGYDRRLCVSVHQCMMIKDVRKHSPPNSNDNFWFVILFFGNILNHYYWLILFPLSSQSQNIAYLSHRTYFKHIP